MVYPNGALEQPRAMVFIWSKHAGNHQQWTSPCHAPAAGNTACSASCFALRVMN
jgi:hypothetical protein